MARPDPIVIAHRGASGYLPEHTLAAKALAHGMGAQFIEQDVVLTRDGIPIVLHDIYLEATTDVADKFPDRAREDGGFYAMDFTLAEIKSLAVHERRHTRGERKGQAVYPGRFPTTPTLFQVPTLDEEVQLLAGLDKASGRNTGLYIELKAPRKHAEAKLDPVAAVLEVLARHKLDDRPDKVYLQCFDDATLRRLRNEVKTALPLIQLIGDNSWGEDSEVDYDYLRSEDGLSDIASYAQGIGPWLSHIYLGKDDQGSPVVEPLVSLAHQRKLLVHPYTFRRDQLPPGMANFDELLALFYGQLHVDGLFTDFPDLAINYLQRNPPGDR